MIDELREKIRLRTRINSACSQFNRKVSHKSWYRQVFGPLYSKRLLFIFGDQRSGTTALNRALAKDGRIKGYGEYSELSLDGDEQLRLHETSRLRRQISQNTCPIILMKPLVESQRARDLLDEFPNGIGVWIFRHYLHVANSNLSKFGMDNGKKNLEPIVNGDSQNWRADRVPEETRELINSHYSEDMNPYDAAALFWVVRNRFYFEQKLESEPRVHLMKYESFAEAPFENLSKIYGMLGFSPPANAGEEIHSGSVSKGKDIELSAPVRKICDEMWERLSEAYDHKAG
ncbi:MAG: hypothetical protein AAFX93_00350 [Verrucomicrobiota bacterium]